MRKLLQYILEFLLFRMGGFNSWFRWDREKIYSEVLFDLQVCDFDGTADFVKEKWMKRLDKVREVDKLTKQ